MKKTILITGSTDGIGKATAETLINKGHRVLLHGRNQNKLEVVKNELLKISDSADVEAYSADLSDFSLVEGLAVAVSKNHKSIDVLINNAGVYKVPNKTAENGIDMRFVVNTISPYLLFKKLTPQLGAAGRVINLSSAAQASVDLAALSKANYLSDELAYAQSKLALTMWSRHVAMRKVDGCPIVIAINPGSLLASKMVKEAYGLAGKDIQIGVDIMTRAALSEEFACATGLYFDNDIGVFSNPHPDALDSIKNQQVTEKIEAILF